jgi:hypothetical protein
MIDEDRLQHLLRSALPRIVEHEPSCDLWPSVVIRMRAPMRRSWLDASLLAVIAMLLIKFPEWLLPLVYHL